MNNMDTIEIYRDENISVGVLRSFQNLLSVKRGFVSISREQAEYFMHTALLKQQDFIAEHDFCSIQYCPQVPLLASNRIVYFEEDTGFGVVNFALTSICNAAFTKTDLIEVLDDYYGKGQFSITTFEQNNLGVEGAILVVKDDLLTMVFFGYNENYRNIC